MPEQYLKPSHESGFSEQTQFLRLGLINEYKATLPPEMIELGGLKLLYGRDDPKVTEQESKILQQGQRLVREYLLSGDGETIFDFYKRTTAYIQGQAEFSTLRDYVDHHYTIYFAGRDQMVNDLTNPDGTRKKVVMFFNHYRQGPEISGFAGYDALGGNLVGKYDMAPLMAKMFIDSALEGSGIQVTRFGKPLYQSEFYTRSAMDAGNHPIAEGVNAFASQIEESWNNGFIPTVCPEAGLRCLKQFKTGGVVSAALADAEAIVLVTQSPWISLIDREVGFHYIATVPIPAEVKRSVTSDHPNGEAKSFTEELKFMMGQALIQINYDPTYSATIKRVLAEDATKL